MGWKCKTPSTIYAIRCSVNGKVYIGRTQDLERRMREHINALRKGTKDIGQRTNCGFQSDFDKYGESKFKLHILEKNVPQEDLRSREAYWIERYMAADPRYGYNLCSEKMVGGFEVVDGLPPNLSTPIEVDE